jgi:ABC-type molybdate transport system substrate-binding protein
MKFKLAILFVFVIVAGAMVWLVSQKKSDPVAEGVANPTPTPSAPAAAETTKITLLYGTEKKDWLEAANTEFAKVHPEIKVELVGKGSLDAAQGILDGNLKPTLWSPADSVVTNLLTSDWQSKYKTDPFEGGDAAPAPLVLSPLVFAIWEDRSAPLLKEGKGHISWKVIHDAVKSNKGWPGVGGKPEWGFVKFGHTDPTRSNSGLQALLLMTFEYYGKTSGLTVGDLLDPKYQAFIEETEKGVSRFETSTGTFMTDMIRFGPSKYDVAVVYESLAISQLENAQGRWGNLRIEYPAVTLWSDSPIALMKGDWVTTEQARAARTFVGFLKSKPIQSSALAYGFRPADPSVPLRTTEPTNPFNRLAQYGLALELPTAATVPDGAVIRNLLTFWSRIVPNR